MSLFFEFEEKHLRPKVIFANILFKMDGFYDFFGVSSQSSNIGFATSRTYYATLFNQLIEEIVYITK